MKQNLEQNWFVRVKITQTRTQALGEPDLISSRNFRKRLFARTQHQAQKQAELLIELAGKHERDPLFFWKEFNICLQEGDRAEVDNNFELFQTQTS